MTGQANYTLKLTLAQANLVRRALAEHLAELGRQIRQAADDDMPGTRQEYGETETLLRQL